MKTKMKQATVHVTGIKARCRKIDRHSFQLPEMPAAQFDIKKAEEEGILLAIRNMKTIQRAVLQVYSYDMEEEDGLVIRSYGCLLGSGLSGDRVDLTDRLVLKEAVAV